jgi:hypothetical protein
LAAKKCSGPCGRTLPLSSFLPDRNRKSGRRSDCKDCYKQRRGPRGKEARRARALEKELWSQREAFADVPALADVLSRALDEVRQIGASGADLAAQIRAVRAAIFTHGCRTVDEVVDETRLSRYAVDRAVRQLVEEKAVEPRDSFLLDADADEPGRPATEYHPTDTPRGEVFTHLLHRRAADDDLL